MKLSDVIRFLDDVKTTEGDLELQSVTGFWIRDVPAKGTRVVVPCIGDGESIEDLRLPDPAPDIGRH